MKCKLEVSFEAPPQVYPLLIKWLSFCWQRHKVRLTFVSLSSPSSILPSPLPTRACIGREYRQSKYLFNALFAEKGLWTQPLMPYLRFPAKKQEVQEDRN